MQNYLTGLYQRTEVQNVYSSWSETIPEVLQGSILGPLPLFNICLNNLFLYAKEVFLSDYAGVNILYAIGNAMDKIKKAPTNDLRMNGNQFHKNVMVSNAKKYHNMYFGNGNQNNDFIFKGIKLPDSCEEEILGVIKDNEPKF